MKLVDFALAHNLALEIKQRSDPKLPRYYATMPEVEIKEGNILIGAHGNGKTPKEAKADYTRKLSGKLLVIDAYGANRYTIVAPELT